jgi:hypothetical protein
VVTKLAEERIRGLSCNRANPFILADDFIKSGEITQFLTRSPDPRNNSVCSLFIKVIGDIREQAKEFFV